MPENSTKIARQESEKASDYEQGVMRIQMRWKCVLIGAMWHVTRALGGKSQYTILSNSDFVLLYSIR
jgi:hypothetical protein